MRSFESPYHDWIASSESHNVKSPRLAHKESVCDFILLPIPWMAMAMMWLSHVFTSQTTSYMIFGLMHQRLKLRLVCLLILDEIVILYRVILTLELRLQHARILYDKAFGILEYKGSL